MSSDLVFEFFSELNGFEELSATTSFLLFKVFDVLFLLNSFCLLLFLSNIFDDKSGFVEAILLWLFNDEFIRFFPDEEALLRVSSEFVSLSETLLLESKSTSLDAFLSVELFLNASLLELFSVSTTVFIESLFSLLLNTVLPIASISNKIAAAPPSFHQIGIIRRFLRFSSCKLL